MYVTKTLFIHSWLNWHCHIFRTNCVPIFSKPWFNTNRPAFQNLEFMDMNLLIDAANGSVWHSALEADAAAQSEAALHHVTRRHSRGARRSQSRARSLGINPVFARSSLRLGRFWQERAVRLTATICAGLTVSQLTTRAETCLVSPLMAAEPLTAVWKSLDDSLNTLLCFKDIRQVVSATGLRTSPSYQSSVQLKKEIKIPSIRAVWLCYSEIRLVFFTKATDRFIEAVVARERATR